MSVSCRQEESRVGKETTWGGRLFYTGMMEGRNENLYGSLDGLNGIYLHRWNQCVCLVDGVSHLCQASSAGVCVILYIICSLIYLRHIATDYQPRWPTNLLTLLILSPRLHTYFAARLCTIATFLMLSDVCGLQTVAVYSKWGPNQWRLHFDSLWGKFYISTEDSKVDVSSRCNIIDVGIEF